MFGLANAASKQLGTKADRNKDKLRLIKKQRQERQACNQRQPGRSIWKKDSDKSICNSTSEGSFHGRKSTKTIDSSSLRGCKTNAANVEEAKAGNLGPSDKSISNSTLEGRFLGRKSTKTTASSSLRGSKMNAPLVKEAKTGNIGPPEVITISTTPYSSLKGDVDEHSEASSYVPFFEMLLNSGAHKDIHDVVDAYEYHKKLVKSIVNIPEFKIYYTFLRCCLALEQLITLDRAKKLIHQALEKLTNQCTTEDAFVAFEVLLRKCGSDQFLTEEEQIRLNNRAEVKRMENADFIIDMKRVIEENSVNIKGLEGTVEQVKQNMEILDYNITQVKAATTKIQQGLRFKMKMEAGVSMVRACLNAASFGMAGELANVLSLVFNKVVDFGDIAHIRTILSGTITDKSRWKGDELTAHLQQGVGLAHQVLKSVASTADEHEHVVDAMGGEITDKKLVDALEEAYPLVAIGFVATMVRPEERSAPIHQVSDESAPFELWSDAVFCDEEEDNDLELHAAVKYSDEDMINELLSSSEPGDDGENLEEKLNQIDSKGRTALDLAALTGQVKLMQLLEKQRVTRYKYANSAKMRAISRKRSALVEAYKEYILNTIDC